MDERTAHLPAFATDDLHRLARLNEATQDKQQMADFVAKHG